MDETAAHLGVNPDTIYKWTTRKGMPAHKLGQLWRFPASEVDQWVKCGLVASEQTVFTESADQFQRVAVLEKLVLF